MDDIVGGGFGAEFEGAQEAFAGEREGVGVEMIVGAGEAVDILQGVFAELAGIAILQGIVVGGFGSDNGTSAVQVDNGLRRKSHWEEKGGEEKEKKVFSANHGCKVNKKNGKSFIKK